MDDLTDAQIDAALARGDAAWASEPRAAAAHYDEAAKQIVIRLTNGCTFSFPPRLAQDLENATAEDLAGVKILGPGTGCIGNGWMSIFPSPAC